MEVRDVILQVWRQKTPPFLVTQETRGEWEEKETGRCVDPSVREEGPFTILGRDLGDLTLAARLDHVCLATSLRWSIHTVLTDVRFSVISLEIVHGSLPNSMPENEKYFILFA